MTILTIELPSQLAQQARRAGLLEPEVLVELIRRQVHLHQVDAAAVAAAEQVFQPFEAGRTPVTNAHVNQLRDSEGV